MKNISISIVAFVAVIFAALSCKAQHNKQTLDTQEIIVLQRALDDEYEAWTTYDRGSYFKAFKK